MADNIERHDNEHITPILQLACYLITEGFTLLSIGYVPNNGQTRAFFYFEKSPKIADCVKLFSRGEAVANLMQYEEARHDLLNRIKHELPCRVKE